MNLTANMPRQPPKDLGKPPKGDGCPGQMSQLSTLVAKGAVEEVLTCCGAVELDGEVLPPDGARRAEALTHGGFLGLLAGVVISCLALVSAVKRLYIRRHGELLQQKGALQRRLSHMPYDPKTSAARAMRSATFTPKGQRSSQARQATQSAPRASKAS